MQKITDTTGLSWEKGRKNMSDKEFKVIETQEAFDQAIAGRLKREQEKWEERVKQLEQEREEKEALEKQVNQLQEELSAAETSTTEAQKKNESLSSQISDYERQQLRTKVALEHNLPYSFASRLMGDSEEELKQDAEAMAEYIHQKPVAPLKDTESPEANGENAVYQNMLNQLNNEGE